MNLIQPAAPQVALTFIASGNTLRATLPANATIAPPGFYMLFLVSVGGAPSTATWIGMGGAVPKQRVNITDAGETVVFWQTRPDLSWLRLAPNKIPKVVLSILHA